MVTYAHKQLKDEDPVRFPPVTSWPAQFVVGGESWLLYVFLEIFFSFREREGGGVEHRGRVKYFTLERRFSYGNGLLMGIWRFRCWTTWTTVYLKELPYLR